VGTWRWYYPRKDTWRLGCPALVRDKPEYHLVLGWLQCAGQTPAPHDAWVLAKDPIGYDSLAPRGPWKNLSATWRLDDSNMRGRPKRYLALGSWQKARLAMATQPPRGARATQPPHGASHCY